MQTSQSKQKTHNQRYSLIYNLNYNRIVNFFINLLLLILLSIYVFIVTINIISYIAQYPHSIVVRLSPESGTEIIQFVVFW